MLSVQALIQRNISRARHSLPFFDPGLRDLITIIPAFFSEGRPSIGIHGRPGCSRAEYELLGRYLGRKPDIIIGRLPDRISIESLIVIPRPSLGGRFSTSVAVVCLARDESLGDEIRAKLDEIAEVFGRNGTPIDGIVRSGPLEQLLVYDIMRTGIVLGGKHPVTSRNAASDSCIYIGDLPGTITEMRHPAHVREWNPFSHYLDAQVAGFIGEKDYPSVLSIPSANPFIIPYLHILRHHEERMDKENIEKMRVSLLALFSSFPPTAEAMQGLQKAWKMDPSYAAFRELGFTESLRLRKWMVPQEENEIPVCSWPPPDRFMLDRLSLRCSHDLWSIAEAREFGHAHAWVALTWAALAGLVGPAGRIAAPQELSMKQTAGKVLLACIDAVVHGADMLIPDDHLLGSIHMRGGRFFFSPGPFAILGQGSKHFIELFETVKKKALLDDIDLKDGMGKG